MVFSSFPVYLDHPNLHQFQQQDHQQQATGVENNQILQHPPPTVGGGGVGVSSIRPGSMVDQARIAKIPMPEPGLKCPRCDSTNTKFCYFNNYSLSQPRHFCKTCRRYWTRGGALRKVPVGGGSRRNKRSKNGGGSSSKSIGTSIERAHHHLGSNNNNNTSGTSPSNHGGAAEMAAGHHHFSQSSTQLPLMAALQSFNHYGGVNLGSGLGGFQAPPQMLPPSSEMGFSNILSSGGAGGGGGGGEPPQWKLPSLAAGFDLPSTNLFQFHNEGVVVAETSSPMMIADHYHNQTGPSSSSSVKMEHHRQNHNLSKQLLESEPPQHWVASTWNTGFSSGLNSSSTGHLL